MSDSVRLLRRQPTRLCHPWDSPGKNTGVGSHSLLQGILLTHGSNLSLSHCGQILYPLSRRDKFLNLSKGAIKDICIWHFFPIYAQITTFLFLPALRIIKFHTSVGILASLSLGSNVIQHFLLMGQIWLRNCHPFKRCSFFSPRKLTADRLCTLGQGSP